MPGKVPFPEVKIVQRSVVKKLWVAVRSSEDREEKIEEVCHYDRCYDDRDETAEVKAERTREKRRRGDSLVVWKGRKEEITVDRVLRALEKMMKNKASGPSVCLVTEMLRKLPMESVYEIIHRFGSLTVGISQQTNAKPEKDPRGFSGNCVDVRSFQTVRG